MPLINTNYIRPGADWTPQSEKARTQGMENHRVLYRNEPRANFLLYPAVKINDQTRFPDIDPTTGDYPRINSNLLKRLSMFWATSLFSRPPILDFNSPALNKLASSQMAMLTRAGFKVALNCSRYGTGIYYLTKTSDGKASVRSLDPRYWIPVVDPVDQQRIVGDVIAVPFNENPNKIGAALNTHISVTVLVPGQPITTNVYKYEQTKLGPLVTTKTGPVLKARMIFPVNNCIEEDHFGESDYTKDVITLVAEVNRRLSGNSSVMDKHTDPAIFGPTSMVSEDANGNRVVNTEGAYLPIDDKDIKPQYLTWDGKLESNFMQIEKIMDQFFALTSTSRAAFGIPNQTTSVESGAALRKHMFNSFQKISSLRVGHEAALSEMSQLMYGEIPSISWPEPFVDGSLEFIQAIQIRLATGTMSRAQAVSELNLVPLSVAEEIVAKIPEPVNMNQNAGAGGEADVT